MRSHKDVDDEEPSSAQLSPAQLEYPGSHTSARINCAYIVARSECAACWLAKCC